MIFVLKVLSSYFLTLSCPAPRTKLPSSFREGAANCQPLRVPLTAAHKLFNCLSNCLPRNTRESNYQWLTPGCRSKPAHCPREQRWRLDECGTHRNTAHTLPAQSMSPWPHEPAVCMILNGFGLFELWLWFSVFLYFSFVRIGGGWGELLLFP